MRIYDTHTHYNFTDFSKDLPEVMEKITAADVLRDAVIGCDYPSSVAAVEMARQDSRHVAVAGIHPSNVHKASPWDLEKIAIMAGLDTWIKGSRHKGKKEIAAIGEIGLDYYKIPAEVDLDEEKERQKEYFRRQIAIAREAGLPVVIHSRDAAEDTYRILEEEKAGELGGVIHCFSYSREMAERFVKMGFFLGIGGVVTRPGSRKLPDVVEAIPLTHLVLETDCPYLAPEGRRGARNDSSNLDVVIQRIAEIKGISEEEVAETTWNNACRLYRDEAATNR